MSDANIKSKTPLATYIAHAPGSLGVFDAAMLVALPQFGKEQLLATLLVFRVLYFVIPFTIAISIMCFSTFSDNRQIRPFRHLGLSR